MYKALYRKWRPADFDSVCGQEAITDILKYQVANKKTSHAYLFCGSRGTGKTSCAKILAKAVNCESPINGNPCNKCSACRSIDEGTATDVIEMDAASNTGVDNVRDIKEEIVYTPATLKYRVYIIDEVHMMSGSAFNALLKTLEEPPSHVIFILATTELHKLPSTIISRCQRYDFKRLTSSVIVSRLLQIAEAEGIDLEKDGAKLIARIALGGMRDAISLLELCAGLNKKIDYRLVFETLGSGNRAEVSEIVRAVVSQNYSSIYKLIADIFMNSRDIGVFFNDILSFYRDMMVSKTDCDAKDYLELTDIEYEDLLAVQSKFTMEKLIYHSKVLEDAIISMQRPGISKRSIAELALTAMCEPGLSKSSDALIARIAALESEVARLKAGVGFNIQANSVNFQSKKAADEIIVNESAQVDTKDAQIIDNNSIDIKECEFSLWHEVTEKMQSLRPALVRFLINAKAYVKKNNKYLIIFSSSFAMKMISSDDVITLIASVISEVVESNVSKNDITISSSDSKNTLFDFVKELNS